MNRDIWVVYDGECPLCSRYVMMYRVRKQVDKVHLIDARTRDPIVDEIKRQNFDLDNGMVVKWLGRYYYGPDALNILAVLGSSTGLFNRLNGFMFKHPGIARRLYPLMVAGRKLLLRMLGRRMIAEESDASA